jgi:ATP-dependent protease ClpP protease subunit
MPNEAFAEIEIRKFVVTESMPREPICHLPYLGHPVAGGEITFADETVRDIDAMEARGVRVILVTMGVTHGGSTTGGHAIYERLRKFSSAGGTVVVHVDHIAASAGAQIALAGDVVVMSSPARLVFHGAHCCGTPRPDDNPRVVDTLRERSLMPLEACEVAISNHDVNYVAESKDAIDLGLADFVAPLNFARSFAFLHACGDRFVTPRKVTFDARARGEAIPCVGVSVAPAWWNADPRVRQLRKGDGPVIAQPALAPSHHAAPVAQAHGESALVLSEAHVALITPASEASVTAAQAAADQAAQGALDALSTVDTANQNATVAQTLASNKSAVLRQAAPPANPTGGYTLRTGDLWYNTDATTNCADSNCKGHTLDASGVPSVGAYPHRGTYWLHHWTGSAWVDAERKAKITAEEFEGNVFKTPNYAFTGTQGGADEVATAGAKMQNAPGGTALLVAPQNLKIGSTLIKDTWFGHVRPAMLQGLICTSGVWSWDVGEPAVSTDWDVAYSTVVQLLSVTLKGFYGTSGLNRVQFVGASRAAGADHGLFIEHYDSYVSGNDLVCRLRLISRDLTSVTPANPELGIPFACTWAQTIVDWRTAGQKINLSFQAYTDTGWRW